MATLCALRHAEEAAQQAAALAADADVPQRRRGCWAPRRRRPATARRRQGRRHARPRPQTQVRTCEETPHA